MNRAVDRTRILATQRCPRSRYWGWEYDGQGLEPVRISIPLATGGAVHAGLAVLVDGGDVETAVEAGRKFLADLAASRGFEVEVLEDESYIYQEQQALTEALIRLGALRAIPDLKARLGEPLPAFTEAELRRELTAGITLLSRPDAVMEGPEGAFIISWKTAANYDSRKDTDARVDMQGLSEAFAVEEALGKPVTGIQMVYLLKGRRYPNKYERGRLETYSPLIRGWRNLDGPVPKYAHSYEWTECDEATGEVRNRRLGKGWQPFHVWEAMGVAEWMRMLAAGEVQPEAGDCLGTQYVIPMAYFRQAKDVERWRRQVTAQERRIAIAVDTLADFGEVMDEDFPQYTHSCAYPSKCAFYDLCWGAPELAEDPVGSQLYRIRVPNHPEMELPEAA